MVTLECFEQIKAVLPPVTKRSMRPSAFQGTKSFKLATESSSPGTQKDLQDSVEVGLSLDSGKMISEKTPGAPSKKDACLPESRGQPSADSTDGADDVPSVSSKGNKKAQSDAPPKGHLLRRYTPKATDEELHQIQKDLNSVVVPLFEKTMTVSDAEPKNGRLVVPKKCAKEYLPELSEPQGFPIRMQDTNGKDWEFHFRFWPNNNSIMYVLEGLKDYLISNQCQAGDKVTFYRIEPEGKLVIGLKKAPPAILDRKKIGGQISIRNLDG